MPLQGSGDRSSGNLDEEVLLFALVLCYFSLDSSQKGLYRDV